MRPVHETAEVIPLIHTAYLDAIAHTKRHAFGEVEVVRNQQRPTVTNIDDETLVTRAVVVIM